MPGEHVSSFDEDEDGWPIVTCSCGFTFGPVPDAETAADVWGDHCSDVYRARAERAETQLAAARNVIRHAIQHWLPATKTAAFADFATWTDDDWADSNWTPDEVAEIQAATNQPDTT
jgi:hypothetical protein